MKTNKIYLTKGLPASGKTTWANKKVLESNGSVININKDDLRAMLHADKHSKQREMFVVMAQESLTKNAFDQGFDVIWSDTNLNPVHEQRARAMSSNVEIVDFTHVPIAECIARDKSRTKSVGEKVIRQQYNQWLRKELVPEPLAWDSSKKTAICFDIDGTLTLGPKNRSPFEWSKVGQDEVNIATKYLITLNSLDVNNTIIIVSGRDSVCRHETEMWLKENYIPYHFLFMRAENDNRPDDIIKEEIIDNIILPKYNIKLWVDDRLKVCRMVYNKGIPLLRVGDPDGDF